SNLIGTGNASSAFPVIGNDSSFISFQSNASDLVDGDLDGAPDVFLSSQTCTPGPPTGLGATAVGNNRIDLTWGGGGGVYEVYRRTSTGTFALIYSTGGTSYSDTTVDGGITYTYMVSNACGSTTTTAPVAQGACGQPPTFGGAAAAWQQTGPPFCTVQVSWAPGTSPCGGTMSYSVYRDTTPAIVPSAWTRLGTNLSPTSYSDSASLSAGTTYYYIVRATSTANGEEDQNMVV